MKTDVVIVEDDAAMREFLVEELSERGWSVTGVATGAEALDLVRQLSVQVVLTDLNLAEESGAWLCRQVRALDPELPVILITAFGSLETAVDAIRAGAYDFVTKPFRTEHLTLVVQRALRLRSLQTEVRVLRQEVLRQQGRRSRIDGLSPAVQRLREQVAMVASSDASVLILGESGVGKEQVARELHDLSARARKPFVAENVAAVPANLLESTLFGHVRGAFTGAAGAREGLFRAADGGTFLLDEIGELAPDLQAKLLRVLEEGRVRPVGADHELPVNVRVIAATHQDLAARVASGAFRADLYYRLAVIELSVPPLRERGRDILMLAQEFLVHAAQSAGKDIRGFHHTTAALLLSWRWTGNVRELRNVVQRAVILARQALVLPADLPDALQAVDAPRAPGVAIPDPVLPLEMVERRHVLHVLDRVGRNKAEAARLLGIGRKTLYRKLEGWGMSTGEDEAEG